MQIQTKQTHRVFHAKSDVGAYALLADAPPRMSSQLFPGMWAPSMYESVFVETRPPARSVSRSIPPMHTNDDQRSHPTSPTRGIVVNITIAYNVNGSRITVYPGNGFGDSCNHFLFEGGPRARAAFDESSAEAETSSSGTANKNRDAEVF